MNILDISQAQREIRVRHMGRIGLLAKLGALPSSDAVSTLPDETNAVQPASPVSPTHGTKWDLGMETGTAAWLRSMHGVDNGPAVGSIVDMREACSGCGTRVENDGSGRYAFERCPNCARRSDSRPKEQVAPAARPDSDEAARVARRASLTPKGRVTAALDRLNPHARQRPIGWAIVGTRGDGYQRLLGLADSEVGAWTAADEWLQRLGVSRILHDFGFRAASVHPCPWSYAESDEPSSVDLAPACPESGHLGPFLRADVYAAAGWDGIGDCAACGGTVSVPAPAPAPRRVIEFPTRLRACDTPSMVPGCMLSQTDDERDLDRLRARRDALRLRREAQRRPDGGDAA